MKINFSGIKKLFEAGARHSDSDNKLIQTMHDHSVSLGAACGLDAEESLRHTQFNLTEATSFSIDDLRTALTQELKELVADSWIVDIFDTNLVYQIGWRGCFYQVDYSINDTGVATFGNPVEVTRKVTYAVKSDSEVLTVPDTAIEPVDVSESATEASIVTLQTELVPLIEAAIKPDGTMPVKLIAANIAGSSGYYSADVLKRDGPKVFKANTQMFIDHLTEKERKEKPEGYTDRLAAVLIEDAYYKDDPKFGAGLYSTAKVFTPHKDRLNEVAQHIGLSINASGKARLGEVNGVKMPIVESIVSADSVDFVTKAGAGGMIPLLESIRSNKGDVTTMADNPEITRLQETVNQLARRLEASTANGFIDTKLASSLLPANARAKIKASVVVPFTESGTVDYTALDTTLTEMATAEASYLASVGFNGIRNAGSVFNTETPKEDVKVLREALDNELKLLSS